MHLSICNSGASEKKSVAFPSAHFPRCLQFFFLWLLNISNVKYEESVKSNTAGQQFVRSWFRLILYVDWENTKKSAREEKNDKKMTYWEVRPGKLIQKKNNLQNSFEQRAKQTKKKPSARRVDPSCNLIH